MAEPALKLAPQPDTAAAPGKRSAAERRRRLVRLLLLVVLPAIVLVVGVGLYLSGGRYVATDNAYIGAQKVLITPDISGKVQRVLVREGQHVALDDPLFEIDPIPFQLNLKQAQSKLDTVKTQFANLKSNYSSLSRLVELGQNTVDLRGRDVERKTSLAANKAGTQVDLDNAKAALLLAELQLELGKQQLSATLNQLLGDPNLPVEQFPAHLQAKAAYDQARRDLDHAVLKSPISGTATQVDSIQLGRFVSAGMPVFSVIDDSAPWIDANPKETDITYLRLGQKVDIEVDSFPDMAFHGTVSSVSPGTGAQFAILPPQNATGNFVKVVQRVPVRIYFDKNDSFVRKLKAGMSVYATIDTRHRRSLANLFGSPAVAAKED
jgi:membrane fusion protein (multidrug efflux system)